MPELVEVRFKGNRKEFFTCEPQAEIEIGDPVVVGLERGRDLGYVSALDELARRKSGCEGCERGKNPDASGKVLRKASPQDAHLSDELRKTEEEIRRKVISRVEKHGLNMKVSDAEWQWDRKKLTIYFTSENRVDFRSLVRDLAGLFRTRIELRQIGARDEARRLDGVGRCGRQFCCSSWLTELQPVSLSLAKDQSLSLNPSQISGGCGRLLCCLRYEHEFYVSNRKRFPKIGKHLRTGVGMERVINVDIFRERVQLRSEEGALRYVGLEDLKAEVAAAGDRKDADHRPPPGSLVTFDEGASHVSDDKAVDAVSPKRSKRRRRRRRRGGPDRGKDGGKGTGGK